MQIFFDCNIYTKSKTTVLKQLKAHTAKYLHLKGYPKSKRKKAYWDTFEDFSAECKKIFDIKGSSEKIKVQEQVWKVKMTKTDYQIYDNQCCIQQIGYSTAFKDKKWEKN